MKLVKWMCECGSQLPEADHSGFVVCEKCGTKYRVDPELNPFQVSQTPVIHVELVEPKASETWEQRESNSATPYCPQSNETTCSGGGGTIISGSVFVQ